MCLDFSLYIVTVYFYYCTVLFYLADYVPQLKETKGYMPSDFSLDTNIIIVYYYYCTVLYCIAPY